jgi:hypothetical protein
MLAGFPLLIALPVWITSRPPTIRSDFYKLSRRRSRDSEVKTAGDPQPTPTFFYSRLAA